MSNRQESQASAQILYHDIFDDKKFINENSLTTALLSTPDLINPTITYLQGREDKKFPLTFLSEGAGGKSLKGIPINDVQYHWPTMNKMDKGSRIIAHSYGATDKPGVAYTYFKITFEDAWLNNQHNIVGPRGTQARIMGKPTQKAQGYEYELQLWDTDPSAYCPLDEIAVGKTWAHLGAPAVSQSYSMGNESSFASPGRKKNQITIIRKSYELGGNISNRTVEVRFNHGKGNSTNYWISEAEWQFQMKYKQSCEEEYWYGIYNRMPDGSINVIDPDSNLPIPRGGGVVSQIPNVDTYSSLTAKKIKSTVRDVMFGATDTGNMEVVLYTGTGGAEEFDTAMKEEASGFSQITGDKFVTGSGYNLTLGGYFTTYQHIDGHRIYIAKLPMLDHGGAANAADKHPITGLPMSSYSMYFLDQSTYDGIPNIRMVHQKGRLLVQGIVQGMAKVPMNFSGNNSSYLNLATERDASSIHYLSSKGIMVNRNTHCFRLECSMS